MKRLSTLALSGIFVGSIFSMSCGTGLGTDVGDACAENADCALGEECNTTDEVCEPVCEDYQTYTVPDGEEAPENPDPDLCVLDAGRCGGDGDCTGAGETCDVNNSCVAPAVDSSCFDDLDTTGYVAAATDQTSVWVVGELDLSSGGADEVWAEGNANADQVKKSDGSAYPYCGAGVFPHGFRVGYSAPGGDFPTTVESVGTQLKLYRDAAASTFPAASAVGTAVIDGSDASSGEILLFICGSTDIDGKTWAFSHESANGESPVACFDIAVATHPVGT